MSNSESEYEGINNQEGMVPLSYIEPCGEACQYLKSIRDPYNPYIDSEYEKAYSESLERHEEYAALPKKIKKHRVDYDDISMSVFLMIGGALFSFCTALYFLRHNTAAISNKSDEYISFDV